MGEKAQKPIKLLQMNRGKTGGTEKGTDKCERRWMEIKLREKCLWTRQRNGDQSSFENHKVHSSHLLCARPVLHSRK
jgi:hypothetical protein